MTQAGVTVILGPKTRLGRAVVDQLRGTGETVVLVARNGGEVAELGALDPTGLGTPRSSSTGRLEVVDASTDHVGDLVAHAAVDRPDGGSVPVRLVVAAMGPVHPKVHTPDFPTHSPAVLRDLAAVGQVLGTGLAVHVVLVSTVIALAPGEDRRYYGGWKNLIEGQLADLVAQHPGCSLSVFYPGRLVESPRKPTERVHATYARVAGMALALDPDRPRSRVVGLDSRIWLVLRSISLCTRSLASAWGRTRPSTGGPVGRRSESGDLREVSK